LWSLLEEFANVCPEHKNKLLLLNITANFVPGSLSTTEFKNDVIVTVGGGMVA
jgi:hypothetical protein